MNQSLYFDYVEEKLTILATRINVRGRLNILNLHLHSENFYLHFLNELYGWKLSNMNIHKQNVEAIDLVDSENLIVVQVSATNTKQKVESALNKAILKKYVSYTFKFVSIAKDCDQLRALTFANPYSLAFNPSKDIIDIKNILNHLLSTDVDHQRLIYNHIQKEFGNHIDIVKLDSNLASIINILSKEDLRDYSVKELPNSFQIENKITFNMLSDLTRELIEEYSLHHIRLQHLYAELDRQGVNKSLAILTKMKSLYSTSSKDNIGKAADFIFDDVIDRTQQIVLSSANYVRMPIDELELCVKILVVDAFVRCKIFLNPPTKENAAA